MTTTEVGIAVLVLAAGASSRMGTPKQLLPWKHTTLLGQAIETAKKSLAHDIFVVLGSNYEKIYRTISETETTVVENRDWERGMGTSVALGVQFLDGTDKAYQGVLILLCDQPLISISYLNEMIRTLEQNRESIIATKYDQKAGVPAIFDRKYFEELKSLSKDKGAKEIIDQNIKDTLLLDPEGTEIDLDTKKEYEQLLDKAQD